MGANISLYSIYLVVWLDVHQHWWNHGNSFLPANTALSPYNTNMSIKVSQMKNSIKSQQQHENLLHSLFLEEGKSSIFQILHLYELLVWKSLTAILVHQDTCANIEQEIGIFFLLFVSAMDITLNGLYDTVQIYYQGRQMTFGLSLSDFSSKSLPIYSVFTNFLSSSVSLKNKL